MNIIMWLVHLFNDNNCYFTIRGRTQIDSFTQNVQWTFGGGEGVKGLDVFKIFVLSTFFPRIICKETLYCSFRLLYMFLVFKNFDNSDISCSPLEHGHGKHVADDFMGTFRPI